MKSAILFTAALCSTVATLAQQPSFTSVALQADHGHNVIEFTTPRQVNVRYYRIEAGNDTNNLQVIGTLPAGLPTMFPSVHRYDVAQQPYTYYRVSMVQMGDQMSESRIVSLPATAPASAPVPRPVVGPTSSIANR